MMIALLPGLRVSEGHVNQSSETTKFRNHQERKCGKAITIVLGWQKSLFGDCKMQYSHRHNKQYVVLAATSGMGSFNKLIHTNRSKRTSIEEHEGHGVKILKEKV